MLESVSLVSSSHLLATPSPSSLSPFSSYFSYGWLIVFIFFFLWLEMEKKSKNCISYIFFYATGILWMRMDIDKVIFCDCSCVSHLNNVLYFSAEFTSHFYKLLELNICFLPFIICRKGTVFINSIGKYTSSSLSAKSVQIIEVTLNGRLMAAGAYCLNFLEPSSSAKSPSPSPHVFLCSQNWELTQNKPTLVVSLGPVNWTRSHPLRQDELVVFWGI